MKNYPMICALIGLCLWLSAGHRGFSEDRGGSASHTESASSSSAHNPAINGDAGIDANVKDSAPVPEINPAAFVGLTGVLLLLFRKR